MATIYKVIIWKSRFNASIFKLLNSKPHILFHWFWYKIYFQVRLSKILKNKMNYNFPNYKKKQRFFTSAKIQITFVMCRSSIFSNDVIIIIYFPFTFFKSFFTYLTFSRTFKIFMIFLSHNKRLIKFSFNYFSTIFSFLYHIIKKFFNSIFINVRFFMVYCIVHQHI